MPTQTIERDDPGPRRRPQTFPLLLALILLSPVPLVATPRSEAEGWIELSGSHFKILSKSNPRKAEQLARELEAFAQVIQRLYPGLGLEPLRPIHIVIFNKRSSFKKHSPKETTRGSFRNHLPPVLAEDAFIARGAPASYLVLNAGASDLRPRFAFLHHYTHYLLGDDLAMPLWLNEGLATYFEPFLLARGKALFGDSLFRLNPKRGMSLERVLQITARSEEYQDPDQTEDFRTQAWNLVHYLFELDDMRRQQTLKALSLLAAGESSARALTQAYGKSLEQLQTMMRTAHRFERYHAQSFQVRDLDLQEDFVVRPLRTEEALCRLGDLLLLGGKEHLAAAAPYFDEALTIAPNDADALTGKGAVHLGLGEPEKARVLLEQAIELEPNARSFHLLGNALLTTFDAEDGRIRARGEPSPPLVMRARGAYQQALQHDPKFIDAYNQLGKTYVYDSQSTQPGIELMERVMARVPDAALALTLIELHSKNGDRVAARAVHDEHLVRLVDTMVYQTVDWVEPALIRADLMAADTWAGENRLQEALTLARELHEKTNNEALKQKIAQRIRAYQKSSARQQLGDSPSLKR